MQIVHQLGWMVDIDRLDYALQIDILIRLSRINQQTIAHLTLFCNVKRLLTYDKS